MRDDRLRQHVSRWQDRLDVGAYCVVTLQVPDRDGLAGTEAFSVAWIDVELRMHLRAVGDHIESALTGNITNVRAALMMTPEMGAGIA